MGANSLSRGSNKQKFWVWLCYSILAISLSFFLFGLLFFFIFYSVRFGLSVGTFKSTGLSSVSLFNFPVFVIKAYAGWFPEFKSSVISDDFKTILTVPLLAIAPTLIVTSFMLARKPSGSKVDYFASIEEVRNLQLTGRGSMLFGRLDGHPLKSKGNDSSLIWFGKGLGKTTSIAIPTILEANDTNIVAVDCSGILARFTSGYRAQIGKVFNFNWDKLDNPEKGEYYPRWNPLSNGNMPKKGGARNNYIKFMSQYLVVKDASNYWEKLASITLEALVHFFVSKIEQAMANDYFLTQLTEGGGLSDEDRQLLLSYYSYMPYDIAEEAIVNVEQGIMTYDNYLPIGSWYNIPDDWQGRDLSFAMITDTLVHRYCSVNSSKEEDGSVIWKNMLGEFLEEAKLFGYSPIFLSTFDYLNHLSKKQRWVVFSVVLDALAIFRKESIRERTSLSDFNLHDVRGIVDDNGYKDIITVYSGAYTKDSAFMTSFFIDMLLGANSHTKSSSEVLFMLDDFEMLPRLKLIEELLDARDEANISSMFLTNEIDDLADIYNADVLEDIIKKTSYKLISAEDNDMLVDKISQLSVYDSKANEINMKSGINYMANPRMAFKSQDYYNLSKDLTSPQLKGEFTKGKYLLLVSGFYNVPIKADSLFFAKNFDLKSRASLREIDDVNDIVLHNRHHQDSEVPNIINVVRDTGISISSDADLTNYIDKQKVRLTENISKIKDSESNEVVPSKWRNTKKQNLDKVKIENIGEGDNWWLGENAFSATDNKKANPFDS